MDFPSFQQSLQKPDPPALLNPLLEALWYEAKGDWEKAHDVAQSSNSPAHSLLHAYLHRKEGDNGNAAYWYNRAGRKMPQISLASEWENLVKEWL